LEEALKALQATVSPDPHPLLRDKKLGKRPSQIGQYLGNPNPIPEEEVLDALGTFSIDDSGSITTHGPTTAMEVSDKYLMVFKIL